MATRHSKQIPIPHKGPLRSPRTEFRNDWPAIIIAAATVVPEATDTTAPFTVIVIASGMSTFFRRSGGQIRLDWNLRIHACDLVHQNSRRSE